MKPDRYGARLRARAAAVVDAVVSDGRSLDAALADAEEEIRPQDRPLLRVLCYGSLRFYFRLRASLRKFVDKPLKRKDRVIESLIIVGFYQLTDTRVPDHAAVSATVEAARVLRRPKLAGLVNAVLRNYLREGAPGDYPDDDEARLNHPLWLVMRLQQDWPEHWESILEANDERAPMWLRVNRRHGEAGTYAGEHALAGRLLPAARQAFCLDEPRSVDELPGFAAGAVSVQDAAAQLAAPWLLEDGGRRILDACAAPGGKTGHLAELMQDGALLTAIDSSAERLARVRDNLDRLELDATLVAADAARPDTWWDGTPFDRILLDAPCSATGVIRRHPDIKVLRRDSDIDALSRLQREILEAMWTVLEPGGRLLYVTCSVLAAENETLVAGFLSDHDDARENRVLHDYNIRDLMCERRAGFQVLPGVQGLDGFYYACIEKAATAGK